MTAIDTNIVVRFITRDDPDQFARARALCEELGETEELRSVLFGPYASHLLAAEHLAGPQQLRNAIAGMTDEQIDVAPISGKWSTRQVICHIADFEPVYADRMKRALAEDEPTIFGGDPDAFAARLAYDQREIEEELQMIESVRKHMARILRTLTADDFQRKVNHSEAGLLTLEQLLTNITNHVPHHIKFIEEKRAAL